MKNNNKKNYYSRIPPPPALVPHMQQAVDSSSSYRGAQQQQDKVEVSLDEEQITRKTANASISIPRRKLVMTTSLDGSSSSPVVVTSPAAISIRDRISKFDHTKEESNDSRSAVVSPRSMDPPLPDHVIPSLLTSSSTPLLSPRPSRPPPPAPSIQIHSRSASTRALPSLPTTAVPSLPAIPNVPPPAVPNVSPPSGAPATSPPPKACSPKVSSYPLSTSPPKMTSRKQDTPQMIFLSSFPPPMAPACLSPDPPTLNHTVSSPSLGRTIRSPSLPCYSQIPSVAGIRHGGEVNNTIDGKQQQQQQEDTMSPTTRTYSHSMDDGLQSPAVHRRERQPQTVPTSPKGSVIEEKYPIHSAGMKKEPLAPHLIDLDSIRKGSRTSF